MTNAARIEQRVMTLFHFHQRSTPRMYNLTAQREMEIIRYKFRTNNRLNLEFRSALSKLFRDYRQPVDDEILSMVTLALPDELVGLASSLQSSVSAATRKGRKGSYKPTNPDTHPPPSPTEPPSIPPQGPGRQPGPTERPTTKRPDKKKPTKKKPAKKKHHKKRSPKIQQRGGIPPQGPLNGTNKSRKGSKSGSKKGSR